MPTIEERLERIEKTLGTLITWLAQVAGAHINGHDAKVLLKMLEGKE